MGGCFSSDEPEFILEDPKDGEKTHVTYKEAGVFTSSWNVLNDEGHKWLKIKNEGKWTDPFQKFELENFVRDGEGKGEVLAAVFIEKTNKVVKHEVEYEPDSDDEDIWGQIFGGAEDDEGGDVKSKMKWTISRSGYVKSKGKKIFDIQVKIKGKTKYKIDVETDDRKLETDIKGVYYRINGELGNLNLVYDNDGWQDSAHSRSWEAPGDFRLNQRTLIVEQNSRIPASVSIILGWALFQFFCPSNYVTEIEEEAKKLAEERLERVDN